MRTLQRRLVNASPTRVSVFYRIFHDVLRLNVFSRPSIGGVRLGCPFCPPAGSEQKTSAPPERARSGSLPSEMSVRATVCFLRGRECVNILPSPDPGACCAHPGLFVGTRRGAPLPKRSLLQGQQLCCQDVFKFALCSAFYQRELDWLSSALG